MSNTIKFKIKDLEADIQCIEAAIQQNLTLKDWYDCRVTELERLKKQPKTTGRSLTARCYGL